MSALRIDDPQRRDRLLLLNALAILLLTILYQPALIKTLEPNHVCRWT